MICYVPHDVQHRGLLRGREEQPAGWPVLLPGGGVLKGICRISWPSYGSNYGDTVTVVVQIELAHFVETVTQM